MNYYSSVIIFMALLSLNVVLLSGCQKDFYSKKAKPERVIAPGSKILSDDIIHLSKDTAYVIGVNLVRNSGQKLIIDAGTLIKMEDRISITINEGALIEASGTADAPIVFTSSATTGSAGVTNNDGTGNHYWYGIRIYGNGQPNSSSGVLKYVRIEFAGGEEGFLRLPCLLMKDVSKGTTIDHVQVSYSFSTNSFEFEGGDFSASYLVSYASSGNDFAITSGYTGMLQHLVAYRHPFFPAVIFGIGNITGLHIDGELTNPSISNITVLGPDLQQGNSLAYSVREPASSLLVTNSARFRIRNAIISSFPIGGFYLNDRNSALYLNNNESEFTYSIIHSSDSNRAFVLPNNIYPPFNSADFKAYMLEPRFNNSLFTDFDQFQFNNPFDYNKNPDPFPRQGSPVLMGADFSGPIFNDAFFAKVSYRGALGADNWMQGWINFVPLQTNYNQ